MLTVSGARGIVGQSMTPAVARAFASAFGSFVKGRGGPASPLVCLGRDSRPSGCDLAMAVMQGLASAGCRVIDLGVVATPTVGVMIGERGADAGMVVTASHNPTQWNGLKCLDRNGLAPPAADAETIIERYRARPRLDAGPAAPTAEPDRSGNRVHVARVLAAVDPGRARAAGFRVVLDSINGAGCAAGRSLLEAMGCDLVHMNGEPTGLFAHTPEPIEENLRDLAARTRDEGAACGFAQDPDADRLAIVDERGRFIGEEYTLVLAARRLLDLAGGGVLATNLSTSRMLDDLAARYPGSSVIRTPVGEAHVAGAMQAAGAIIGGEGNGGVIFPPVCWVRDSLSAMALVLDLLAADGRSLGAIVDEMPRYRMLKRKMDLAEAGGRAAIAPALDRIAAAFADERVDRTDGVRVDFAEGWVHVRPSNTEPIVRVIAEATTDAAAGALADRVTEAAGLASNEEARGVRGVAP